MNYDGNCTSCHCLSGTYDISGRLIFVEQSVRALTEDKTDEDKEQIYEDSKSVVDKVPKCDTVITFGDLNAKLGKEGIYSNVTGKHTLHEGTNRNGEMLCEFASASNMIMMSTQFQHKQIDKATWIPLSQNTINQTIMYS